MTSPILVTGGTGTLGRQVVPRLRDAGYDVRVFSRRAREAADGIEYVTGDLLEDRGIDAAVRPPRISSPPRRAPGSRTWCSSR